MKSMETKSTTQEEKTSAEDKEKKDSTSASKSTKFEVSMNNTLPEDFKAHVVALDVQWYFELGSCLEFVADTYLSLGHAIAKNKQKLLKPKGSGGGGMMF